MTMNTRLIARRGRGRRSRRAASCTASAPSPRGDDAGSEELVQGARHRKARPPGAVRTAAACSDVNLPARTCQRRSVSASRSSRWRRSSTPRTASSSATGSPASASRRPGSACSGPTPTRPSTAATATPATSCTAGDLVRHHRADAEQLSASCAAQREQKYAYTWGKIWNSHAYNACSQMPRFGDAGILTEAQIKDVMALLLDPNSPVNK